MNAPSELRKRIQQGKLWSLEFPEATEGSSPGGVQVSHKFLKTLDSPINRNL